MFLIALLAVPAVLLGPTAELPSPTPAELDTLLARLAGALPDRLAVARALSTLPPGALEECAARLSHLGAAPGAERPAVPAATLRAVLLEIGAQVPNPKPDGPLYVTKWDVPAPRPGTPRTRRPKRVRREDPETIDWLVRLAELDPASHPELATLPGIERAQPVALEAVALARSLGASGRAEAVEPLFQLAFAQEGVFRDECGRAIRALDGAAVPELIRRSHQPGHSLVRQRRYAAYQLDRMDRARPQQAVSSAPDDRVRAAILREYGVSHALDAVEAVLGQVDAPARQVRREARVAWLGYVSGPPPPPAPKRKRKLPGGGTESEEKEDYLNYRERAEIALAQHVDGLLRDDPPASDGALGKLRRAQVGPTSGAAPPDAATLTRGLFEYYDARREAEWEAQYAFAADRERAGDLDAAVAGYATILGHDPTYPHRERMAGAFQSLGESLAGSQPERALALLREAAALDPARAPRLDAELAFRAGQLASARGTPEPALYRRALALDPRHAGARAALAQLAEQAARRTATVRAQAALLALGVLTVGLLGSVVRRRRA